MSAVTDASGGPVALARRFPPDFAFGAATAAYQIEGAVADDGRGPSIWDTFSHTRGRTRNGETGDVACDHYHRWRSDLDLMAELGLRAYRFSIAWPRVQPEGRGPVNQAGLDFYDRLVDGLLERGIEPWLTLYHWDLPQALQDAGGWTDASLADRLAEYAGIVAGRLGDRVGRWITLNEPRTHAFIGHAVGRHAPGGHGWANGLRAAHHLHLAHAAAVRAIRTVAPEARIGVCHDVAHVIPASQSVDDAGAARRHDGAMHRWFLDPTFGRGYPSDMVEWYSSNGLLEGLDLAAVAGAEPIDFLAVNYYRRERIADVPVTPDWGIGSSVLSGVGESTGNGWEVWPDGLRAVLSRIQAEYGTIELAVTENGATYPDAIGADGSVEDAERRSYLARHVAALADARDDGVPVNAYFVWSLLDNFEWGEGYGARFGIVHVDFPTQRRTVKSSGRWYQELLGAADAR
ncbi:MAG TPA: GH1 family beta-glucosidase [Candidatus Limnocylindria bacterium]|nr:GH1 family beta-glucosidase [Candidatus Limnocylindria bacterium]